MTTNLANALLKATGTGSSRTLGERFAEEYNVKDFGAKGDNDGTSTGGHDDTLSIQSALNAACATGGVLHFPLGQYRITSRIAPPAGMIADMYVRVTGSRGAGNHFGSRIVGFFNDYLFSTGYPDPSVAFSSPIQGIGVIENMGLQNFHATGSCIIVGGGSGTAIRDCSLYCNKVGIRGGDSAFLLEVDNVAVTGSGTPVSPGPAPLTGAYGIWNATNIRNCRVASFDHAIHSDNVEAYTVIGCSLETNNVGIYLNGTNGALIAANQFESNSEAIILNGSAIECSANWLSAPAGNGVNGIVLGALTDAVISGNNCSLSVTGACIDCSNVIGQNVVVMGNFANVGAGSGVTWKMPTQYVNPFADISFIGGNSPYPGVTYAHLPVEGSGGAGNSLVVGSEYEISDAQKSGGGAAAFGDILAGGGTNKYRGRYVGSGSWIRVG